MLKTFFDKADKYWFLLITTVLLGYGFFLTHSSIGIDDEILNIYARFPILLILGRPFAFLFEKIFHNNSFLPFWFDFLSVIILTLSVTIFADCFIKNIKNNIFDKTAAIIFSCISVSFPFLIFILIFSLVDLEFSFNMLLCAIALNCFYKYFSGNKKIYLLLTFLCLTFVLGIYETNILFFVISVLFIEFINLINTSNASNLKTAEIVQASKKIILTGLISSLSYVSDLILLITFKKIYDINYNRVDDFLKYDISSLNNFFISAKTTLITFFKTFLETCTNNFGSLLSVICYIIFSLILIYFTVKKKNLFIFLIGIILMSVPFFIFLALGNANLPYRNYVTLSFFNAFVFTNLYILFKNNKILSKIIITLCCFTVLYSTQEINKIAYTEYLKFQDDAVFARNIMYNLEKRNLQNKPLIFIGTRETRSFKYQYHREGAEVNLSIFNWDRYDDTLGELFTKRSYYFMRELGFPVKGYFEDNNYEGTIEDLLNKIKEQIKDMNTYPQENSIKETDEYVLIKIGNSVLE